MSSKKKKQRGPRRSFTAEFKADVVRMCRAGGESIPEVARRLDLSETSVRAWVEQAKVDEARGTEDRLTSDEREELARLRRENKRLLMERDILKNDRGRRPTCWPRSSGEVRRGRLGRSGRLLLGGPSPLKNMVHGALRTWHW